ncbi:MAG TPA: T9SS type A sorting domain-containing protein, partial [Candidatus Kapabacteria bacterium]|nr:T9SS type A sorting domain-containing protein [Candidatus Kapabacteria bacterium]
HVVARFSLAAEELVTLEVIGMRGERLVRTAPETLGAGTHERALDVGGLAAGIYTLTARAGDAVRVRRFVITR